MSIPNSTSSVLKSDLIAKLQQQIDSINLSIKSNKFSAFLLSDLAAQKVLLQQQLDALTAKVDVNLEDEKNATRLIAISKAKQLSENAKADSNKMIYYIGGGVLLLTLVWFFTIKKEGGDNGSK